MNDPLRLKIHNPLSEDFYYPWTDDANVTYTLKVPAQGVAEFLPHVATFMGKHLIDHIINVRGVRDNVYLDQEHIAKEVFL